MSAERLAESLGALTDRKGLLRKAGAAGLASALFVMGRRPAPAEAIRFQHGCGLCDTSLASCPTLACTWCWYGDCHTNPGGSSRHRTHCCEGYRSGSHCAGDCFDHWACSFFGGNIPC